MTKWRKATIGVVIGLFVAAVIYDIIVATQSPGDTESNVILTVIYSFPFLGFALGVIVGHWTSVVRVEYGRWPALAFGIVITLGILAVSIALAVQGRLCGPATVATHTIAGLVCGTLTWSQRGKK